MPEPIERFTLAERRLHWTQAAAIAFLALTGFCIWQDWDKLRPAGVNVISQSHVWLGGGTLLAVLLAFALFRRRRVLASRSRFNLGQRLNLLALQLLVPFMFASGGLVYVGKALGLTKHTRGLIKDAHLVSAGAIAAVVLGHLVMVFLVPKNRGILAAMLTGRVGREVLARSAPQWLAKLESAQPELSQDARRAV